MTSTADRTGCGTYPRRDGQRSQDGFDPVGVLPGPYPGSATGV